MSASLGSSVSAAQRLGSRAGPDKGTVPGRESRSSGGQSYPQSYPETKGAGLCSDGCVAPFRDPALLVGSRKPPAIEPPRN